jgi:hypothetical protein
MIRTILLYANAMIALSIGYTGIGLLILALFFVSLFHYISKNSDA